MAASIRAQSSPRCRPSVPGVVKTFSIGFHDEKFNELPFARMVANRLGTDHHELILEPNVVELLTDLAWDLDELFGDASAIPTYMVSKMAAQHVKVVLSGDGGDELFAGYARSMPLSAGNVGHDFFLVLPDRHLG